MVAPAGYIPPQLITGDADPLFLGESEITGYEFPSGTKISLSQEKIITATKINGRKGTIKEMSGFDDWQITIEFPLLAATYSISLGPLVESMIRKLKNLKKLWLDPDSIPVLNEKMNALGIKYLVIKKFEIPDAPIQYNQPVKLTCLSDEEYNLDSAGSESIGVLS
ncbi:MAG: DUF6046 domain-containing protein [Leptospira sp.]|nr:DUF6046 domain-containing protein [Leptospira sp.]